MKRVLILALAVSIAALAQQNRGSRAGSMRPQGAGAPRAETHRAAGNAGAAKGATHSTSMVTLKPQLSARIQPLLPEGTTAEAAAQGFKNTGQFVAALHVSKNLGIPFADLKAQMTGTEAKSLGQAIETLKPDLPEAKKTEAVREATRQARQDEREAHTNDVHSEPAK